jgi:hypothetical protein
MMGKFFLVEVFLNSVSKEVFHGYPGIYVFELILVRLFYRGVHIPVTIPYNGKYAPTPVSVGKSTKVVSYLVEKNTKKKRKRKE